MVKAELVLAKLQKLEERAERVRTHARTTAAELESDRDALDVVTLNLMLCVQACLDIASHIIGDEGWRLATTLGDSFERLREHGVLSKTTANALKNAAGLRNIVVHAYDAIDVTKLHAGATDGLRDLDAFAREVTQWLRARPTA